MATDRAHRPRESGLTGEQREALEAIRAERRSPEARKEEIRVREALGANTVRRVLSKPGATEPRWVSWWRSVASSCPCAASVNGWGLSERCGRACQDRQRRLESIRERPATQSDRQYPRKVRQRLASA